MRQGTCGGYCPIKDPSEKNLIESGKLLRRKMTGVRRRTERMVSQSNSGVSVYEGCLDVDGRLPVAWGRRGKRSTRESTESGR